MINKIIIFCCFGTGVFLTRAILNTFKNPLKDMLSISDCLLIIVVFMFGYMIKRGCDISPQ
ncbi:hypothetical protein EWY02_02110 [Enterococcus faecium]|nr:hypothetical protein [Enterococcus faecium]